MGPAWLVPPEHSVVRTLWVVTSFAGVIRAVDVSRGAWSLTARLTHVLSVVDTRRLVRASPSVAASARAVAATVAWEGLAWGSYLGMKRIGDPTSASGWGARWAFALAFAYTLTEGAYLVLALAYAALGFRTPTLHRSPAASRSVQEFWGERWNRTVSAWLGDTFFRPLARKRRPLVGAVLAFAVSAVFHAYIGWVGAGPWMGALCLVFFLLQGALLVVERYIGVRQWPAWAGHAWAVFWMVGLSPLFTEPMARVVLR